MTFNTLKDLSIDDLFSLMVTTLNEYLSLHKSPEAGNNVDKKRAELKIIQKLITKRKAEQQFT